MKGGGGYMYLGWMKGLGMIGHGEEKGGGGEPRVWARRDRVTKGEGRRSDLIVRGKGWIVPENDHVQWTPWMWWRKEACQGGMLVEAKRVLLAIPFWACEQEKPVEPSGSSLEIAFLGTGDERKVKTSLPLLYCTNFNDCHPRWLWHAWRNFWFVTCRELWQLKIFRSGVVISAANPK